MPLPHFALDAPNSNYAYPDGATLCAIEPKGKKKGGGRKKREESIVYGKLDSSRRW